jgi:phosphoserine phosphatase RsbU/P
MFLPGQLLIADDDPAARRVLALTLERMGYHVAVAASGREALAALEQSPCDLLILDFAMPDLNGKEVCLQVRADPKFQGLPIIVLTGMGGESDELVCLEAGANDFVTKPVRVPVLSARLQTQLRLQELRKEMARRNVELEHWLANYETDLDAARIVQRAVLPAKPPRLPGFAFDVFYQPLIQVGGDVYGWHQQTRNRIWFWLVDATGHGASAALYTTLTALIFNRAIETTRSPAAVLQYLNREIYAVFQGKGLLAAGCALLQPPGRLLFAGAALPPFCYLRSHGKVENIESRGTLIGFAQDLVINDSAIDLAVGDQWLAYTDGLYSFADSRTNLTYTYVSDMVASKRGIHNLSAFVHSLIQDEERSRAFSDDVTVLAISRTG